MSEKSDEAQNTRIAVLASLSHGAIADKMLDDRAGSKDDRAMNPLPFFLSCVAGRINRHQQAVIENLEEQIRVNSTQCRGSHGRIRRSPQRLCWSFEFQPSMIWR
jgi:hypothetical protein